MFHSLFSLHFSLRKCLKYLPPTLKFVSSIALSSSFSCLAVDLVAPKITLRERRRIGDGQSSEGACEDARYQGWIFFFLGMVSWCGGELEGARINPVPWLVACLGWVQDRVTCEIWDLKRLLCPICVLAWHTLLLCLVETSEYLCSEPPKHFSSSGDGEMTACLLLPPAHEQKVSLPNSLLSCMSRFSCPEGTARRYLWAQVGSGVSILQIGPLVSYSMIRGFTCPK